MQHTHERRVCVCIVFIHTDKVRRQQPVQHTHRMESVVEHTLPEESTAGLRMQQKIDAGDILAVNGYLQRCVEPFVVHLSADLSCEKATLSPFTHTKNTQQIVQR